MNQFIGIIATIIVVACSWGFTFKLIMDKQADEIKANACVSLLVAQGHERSNIEKTDKSCKLRKLNHGQSNF